MSRFNLGKNTSRPTPNGGADYNWVENRINEVLDYRLFDHYEFDPAEVTSIILTDEDIKNADVDPRYYGAITVNFLNRLNNEGIQPEGDDFIFPLESHIKDYPLKGETVLVFTHPDLDRSFYINANNSYNLSNNNINFGASTYGDKTRVNDRLEFNTFKPDVTKARHIKVNEGDIVFEGRFGQSINLGNINNEPIIKIRAGQRTDLNLSGQQPIDESWNNDGSSIYITGFDNNTTNDESINGKKILIKSDGIFINGRNSAGISANQINLNSKNVSLGSGDKQPIVKGRELVLILKELITALNIFAKLPILTPATLPGNAASLATAVNQVSNKLNNILSKEVQTA